MIERHGVYPPSWSIQADPEPVPAKDMGEIFWFWCDGCDTHHSFRTKLAKGEKGPTWTFDGNMEKPTFSPSLLVNKNLTSEHKAAGGHRCHLFLKKGIVQYLGDCTHKLKGTSVPVKAPK